MQRPGKLIQRVHHGEVTRTESAPAAIAVVDNASKTDLHRKHLAKRRCHLPENFGH